MPSATQEYRPFHRLKSLYIHFSFIQILEAYIIFPYVVGSRLKINTLIIILVVIIGGIIWGAAGLILFIPSISIAN